MARLPNCCGCEKCDGLNLSCSIYPDGIPKDIYLEYKNCEHSVFEKDDSPDDKDLPIAKGR